MPSRSLDALVTLLCQAKTTSHLLANEERFMSHDAIMIYRATNYLTLADFSDEVLSEIERVLVEVADPAHVFWSVDSNFFQEDLLEERRRAGIDVDAECAASKAKYQKSFADVANLIRFRLGKSAEPGV